MHASVSPSPTGHSRLHLEKYRLENLEKMETLPIVLVLRAGHDDEFEDEDYGENEYDDESDAPLAEYDHSLIDPPSDLKRAADDKGQQPRHEAPPSFTRSGKRPKHWSQRLASQSLKMGSQLAWGTVQQTGKFAYQLVKPRRVNARELQGLWRLDQQVVGGSRDLASVATIELDSRHGMMKLTLPKREGDEEDKAKDKREVVGPFSFRKMRLGSYQTEFVAPAFLVGCTPRTYGYRGIWQRKLADPKVIKLVGKIYKVKRQRFGKSRGVYQFGQPVGTFVARRRMTLAEDEYDDDDYSDEYDGQVEDEGFEDNVFHEEDEFEDDE